DVALSVAREIHRKVEKIRWHELGLAHRSRPGTHELVAGDMALLKNFQRDKKFVAEIGVPVVGLCQSDERADRVPFILVGAIRRLHSPDGEDDPAFDLK